MTPSREGPWLPFGANCHQKEEKERESRGERERERQDKQKRNTENQ